MGVKETIREKLEFVKADYATDLAALSEEALSTAANGTARIPYDFTYEVVVVNQRMANGMVGKVNVPWPFEGWAKAPEEFKKREHAVAELNRSMDAMLAAWDSLSEEEISRELTSASGAKSTPIDMALMCVQHMSYHDGQLNFVQAVNGDMEVHWK